MAKPVKIAVAGAGLIGKRHIEHVVAEPLSELAAVVDPSSVGQQLAQQYGAPWFPDFSTLLKAEKPEGVIFATPTQMHVENGLEAVAARIPMMVEKPISVDVASAERLVLAAEAAEVALLIGHHRRHNPIIARAKEIIGSGRLGTMVSVHGYFWLLKPDDYFDVAWRREKGAGPILTNLIHDIDLLRHLTGEVDAVQAMTSNRVRGNAIEETAVVLLRFKSGALGTMNISDSILAPWSWEHTASENPSYPQTDQICYTFGGTRGSLSVPKLEVWSNAVRQSWLEPFEVQRTYAAQHDPLRLQIQHFCRVIREGEAPVCSGREGLETLRVIEAVQRAAEAGGLAKVG